MYRILQLIIVTFTLTLLCTNTHALDTYEWSVDLNTGSKHSDAYYSGNKFYNEDNEGVGLTYGYKRNIDLKFGFFENSYYKTTVYAGAVFNQDFYMLNDMVISPGIGLIFASGYDNTPMDAPMITPVLHPSLSFGHKSLRSTIGYIPFGDVEVVTFQTQILF